MSAILLKSSVLSRWLDVARRHSLIVALTIGIACIALSIVASVWISKPDWRGLEGAVESFPEPNGFHLQDLIREGEGWACEIKPSCVSPKVSADYVGSQLVHEVSCSDVRSAIDLWRGADLARAPTADPSACSYTGRVDSFDAGVFLFFQNGDAVIRVTMDEP